METVIEQALNMAHALGISESDLMDAGAMEWLNEQADHGLLPFTKNDIEYIKKTKNNPRAYGLAVIRNKMQDSKSSPTQGFIVREKPQRPTVASDPVGEMSRIALFLRDILMINMSREDLLGMTQQIIKKGGLGWLNKVVISKGYDHIVAMDNPGYLENMVTTIRDEIVKEFKGTIEEDKVVLEKVTLDLTKKMEV